jgi:hypothetical protein
MLAGIELSKPYIRVWLYALAVHAALFSIFYGPPGGGVLFTVIGGGVIFALARRYHDTETLILFVAQVLYGYIFVGFLGLALSELYDTHVNRDSPLRPGNVLMFGVVGLLVGWLTGRAKPALAATGKWIWILPVPIFVYSFLHDWLRRCEFCPDATTVYFYSSAALDGMLTSQAFSLSGYSLGAWLASRARVQPRPPALL